MKMIRISMCTDYIPEIDCVWFSLSKSSGYLRPDSREYSLANNVEQIVRNELNIPLRFNFGDL